MHGPRQGSGHRDSRRAGKRRHPPQGPVPANTRRPDGRTGERPRTEYRGHANLYARNRPSSPAVNAVRRQNVNDILSWTSLSHGTDMHGHSESSHIHEVSSPRFADPSAARRIVLRDRISVDLPLVPAVKYRHDGPRAGVSAHMAQLHEESVASVPSSEPTATTIMDCVEVSAMRDLVRDVRRRVRALARKTSQNERAGDARRHKRKGLAQDDDGDHARHLAPALRILQIETNKLHTMLKEILQQDQSQTDEGPSDAVLQDEEEQALWEAGAGLEDQHQQQYHAANASAFAGPEAQEEELFREEDLRGDEQMPVQDQTWELMHDKESGLDYYYNAATQESSWEAPDAIAGMISGGTLSRRRGSRGNQSSQSRGSRAQAQGKASTSQVDRSRRPSTQSRKSRREEEAKVPEPAARYPDHEQDLGATYVPLRENHATAQQEAEEANLTYAPLQDTYDPLRDAYAPKETLAPAQSGLERQAWTDAQPAPVPLQDAAAVEDAAPDDDAIAWASSTPAAQTSGHAAWPEWSRVWEADVGAYLYVNNHTAKMTRKAPKGVVFADDDDGKSPLTERIVLVQSMYRGHRAREETRQRREEAGAREREVVEGYDAEDQDTFDVNGLQIRAREDLGGADDELFGPGAVPLPAMTPKTDTSYSDMFAGITLDDDDYDADDPFAAFMGDAMEVQSPSEDVLDDLRASGLDELDWNRSIELLDDEAPAGIPTVDGEDAASHALVDESAATSTPKSLLDRRGSTKKLLIATEDDEDDDDPAATAGTGEGPPPEVLIWSALNARATPTGRQVGEWVERVDPESEEVYYANLATGESKWEMPADFDRRSGHLQQGAASDEAWEELVSPTGRHLFWYNWSNGERAPSTPPSIQNAKERASTVTLTSLTAETPNRIQAEYLWELLRLTASAVMSCGAWVCLEEPTHGDQFYHNKSSGTTQWERPEDWDDAEAMPIEEVSRSSAVEDADDGEDVPKMGRRNSSLRSLVHAKKLARALTMKRKNRSWSCVVSPHERCLFEFNWDTCLVRKTLNLNAKQVNPMRRFLLQNTTTLADGLQLGGPRQLPGGTRHLWSLLRGRAVETGLEASGWKEYLDELSRELFYGKTDGSEWQWEKPEALSTVGTRSADFAVVQEGDEAVPGAGPDADGAKARMSADWRTVKSLEGGTYWIHRETGRKTYVDPADPGSFLRRTNTMSTIQSSTPSFQVSSRAILSPKGKKLFDFGGEASSTTK